MLSTYQIARQQQITPRYVRVLYTRYQVVPDYLVDARSIVRRFAVKPRPLSMP